MTKTPRMAAVTLLFIITTAAHGQVTNPGDCTTPLRNTLVYYADENQYYFIDWNLRKSFIPSPDADQVPTDPSYDVLSSWFSGQHARPINVNDLEHYAIASTISLRPGTALVKLATDPFVYAVAPGGTLRRIDGNDVAAHLYGPDWQRRVVTVPEAYFVTQYHAGEPLEWDSLHPDGTLLQFQTSTNQTYLIMGGVKRRFVNGRAFAINNYRQEDVVINVDPSVFHYPTGIPISKKEPALVTPTIDQDPNGDNPVAWQGCLGFPCWTDALCANGLQCSAPAFTGDGQESGVCAFACQTQSDCPAGSSCFNTWSFYDELRFSCLPAIP